MAKPEDRAAIILGEIEPPPPPPVGATVTDENGHQWKRIGTDVWVDLTCSRTLKSAGFSWTWALVFADCDGDYTVTIE